MKENKSGYIKVGMIIVASIAIMAVGYNFLKGNAIFGKHFTLFASYHNIEGLAISNPVIINGFQVGTVKQIDPDPNMKSIKVSFDIVNNIQIPENSIANIVPNPIGNAKVEIVFGTSTHFLKDGDSIKTEVKNGIVDDVLDRVDPIVAQVKAVTVTLDSLLMNVNSAINPKAKNNISHTLTNLELITSTLLTTSQSLQKMLDLQNGTVNKSFRHIEKLTQNLDNQTDRINNVISNLDETSEKLAAINFQKTIQTIEHSVTTIDSAVSKLNNKDGSMGMLMNDPTLYKNLTATTIKLNTLLDDVRLHPRRYISLSVLGRKKDKSAPLDKPLDDPMPEPNQKP